MWISVTIFIFLSLYNIFIFIQLLFPIFHFFIKNISFFYKKYFKFVVGFFCFTGLPLAVLLLYWAGLPPAVLGPSVLSKRVETGPTGTQIGLACAQTIPCLPRTCLRQAELF